MGFIFREKPKLRHLRGDMVKYFNIPVSQLHGIKEGNDYVKPDGTVIENARITTDADKAVSYAYCSDTLFDERVAEAVKGVDTIYHEATYDDDMLEQARQRGHSTARQAGIIARLAGARQLVIGHYSKRYITPDILVKQASEEFANVIAVNEGLKIDLL